jgi:hypothetical protein
VNPRETWQFVAIRGDSWLQHGSQAGVDHPRGQRRFHEKPTAVRAARSRLSGADQKVGRAPTAASARS